MSSGSPAASAPVRVDVRGLSKSFGPVRAVTDLSFTVEPGSVTGFLRHLAHDQGRTVLVSSRLLAEVEQTADRVVIVGAGRLVREGSLDELRAGASGAGTVQVASPEASRLAEVLQHAGHQVTAGG